MDTTYTVKINPYDQNKLSALVQLDNTEAVRFDYTVHGKTSNADFYYSTDEYSATTQIIVVGLYADYRNTVTLNVYTADNEATTFTVIISTEGQDYGDVPLALTINIDDSEMAENTLGLGWFVTSAWNGYDINGDLRITGHLSGILPLLSDGRTENERPSGSHE